MEGEYKIYVVQEEDTGNKQWIIKRLAVIIYYILFIAFSYEVFLTCRETRHVWIVVDILNGILGGILIIYPLNSFRYGFAKTFEQWGYWLIIFFVLSGIAFIVSMFLDSLH